jgi:methionyl-tRNA formyltransferase
MAQRPLSHLTMLGYSPVMLPLADWARGKGLGVSILTSPDQADQLRQAGVVDFRVFDKLDDRAAASLPEAFQASGVAISLGARWIFRAPVLESLFYGRLLNAHGTRLPLDRGGGGFSWRIMRGDRIGSLTLHLVDEGIDTGSIVACEDYVIPAGLRTSAAIAADYEHRLADFLVGFLERGAPMGGLQAQNMSLATYYPRLHTPTHGWIDWSWPAADIERFILAFDDPFPGARTCWRDRIVTVRQAQLHVGEVAHHPFQAGLIVRNNGRWLVVALGGRESLIVERLFSEEGDDLLVGIREGDRLFTPKQRLDEAMEQRVTIGPQGLKPARPG